MCLLVTSVENSCQDLLYDVTGHGSILKNNKNTTPFLFSHHKQVNTPYNIFFYFTVYGLLGRSKLGYVSASLALRSTRRRKLRHKWRKRQPLKLRVMC